MIQRKLQLFGSVHVESDEGEVPRFRSQRTMALLGYLVAEQRAVSRDALAALFWPDESQSKGRSNLRRELHNLNQILPDCWEMDRQSVEFAPADHIAVDLFRFRESEQTEQWADAAALVRGDFLEGLYLDDNLEFETWLLGERERWRQRFETILNRLIEAHSQRAQYNEALRYARKLLQTTPWNEEVHRQVMLMLAWTGQRASALKQFEACRHILAEELAVEPAAETMLLFKRIREADFEGAFRKQLAAAYPHLTHPNNLPIQTSSFVGRSAEVQAVRAELARPEVRLLTLTGPGGTGKTRLALQVAAAELDDFVDGVFFVELAPISDPALVGPTIAETLAVRQTATKPIVDHLKEHFQAKQVLLVLDNFEHVLPAAPDVSELLSAAPGLKIVVTSRSLLRLSGEWSYPVPPLKLPELGQSLPPNRLADYEALQLFSDRAKAVKADFALSNDNAGAVTEICVRLDGLPLAIELTAARVRLLPPQEILSRLSRRLQFVTGGPQDLPARQRTLRDTIEWSYDLLAGQEQMLFQRLAVFAGGFTLEAVEAVCDATGNVLIVDDLESLVDKNLVRRSKNRGDSHFEMLETIHEFALERLEAGHEMDKIYSYHARYFLKLAEAADTNMWTAEQATWSDRLVIELDNFRTALAWSIENQIGIGLRLAGALGQFWHLYGHHNEGRRWLDKALKKDESKSAVFRQFRAKALKELGVLTHYQGDYLATFTSLTQSVDLWRELEDDRGLAETLCYLGMCLARLGRLAEANGSLEKSIKLFRQHTDKNGLKFALFVYGHINYLLRNYAIARSSAKASKRLAQKEGDTSHIAGTNCSLGRICIQQGQFPAARKHIEKSLSLYRTVEDITGLAMVLNARGALAYIQGDYETARESIEESLLLQRKTGHNLEVASSLLTLGRIAVHQKDYRQAMVYLRESLKLFYEFGKPQHLARCFVVVGGVAVAENRSEKATQLFGAAKALLDGSDDQQPEFDYDQEYESILEIYRADYERNVATARQTLGNHAFSAAWNMGRNMPLEEVLTYIMES